MAYIQVTIEGQEQHIFQFSHVFLSLQHEFVAALDTAFAQLVENGSAVESSIFMDRHGVYVCPTDHKRGQQALLKSIQLKCYSRKSTSAIYNRK